MLEDFKKQQQASAMRERSRMPRFVVACVVLALFVVAMQKCSQAAHGPRKQDAADDVQPGGVAPAPARLDVEVLKPLLYKKLPSGDDVERTERYATEAIERAWDSVRASPGHTRVLPTSVEDLRATSLEEGLGRAYEFEAIVVSVSSQVWEGDNLLWNVVLATPDPEGEYDGAFLVAVARGRPSDFRQGRPRYVVPGAPQATQLLETGDNVRVRGYYVQRRSGTVGDTPFAKPTPVLLATAWRDVVAIDDRAPPPETLAEIDFAEVRDLSLEQTREEVIPEQRRVIQWARAKGYEAIAREIKDGTLEVEAWDDDTFETWSEEVEAALGDPRPWTKAARGKIFRFPGHLASFASEDWTTLPVNEEGIDHLELMDVLSDYYDNNVIRTYSAFPRSTYPIEGRSEEYLDYYGVFVKNFSFQVRKPGQGQKWRTMPAFVLLHAEKASIRDNSSWRQLMMIVAIVIVVLGLLFWLVLVRGESKEAAKLEERRRKLRKNLRAGTPPANPDPSGAPAEFPDDR